MTVLTAIAKELFGLFVDDGSLALAILAWVAVVAALVGGLGFSGAGSSVLLFAGLIAILFENVLRRARSR
jgi:hypothetical protein